MDRNAADNFALDLMIAERFGMTLDAVDELPLGLVEIVREALWADLFELEGEPVDGDNSDTVTTFKCDHAFERDEVMINVCTKCGIEGEPA